MLNYKILNLGMGREAGVNFDHRTDQHCSELQLSRKGYCLSLGKAHRKPNLFI